MVEEKKLSKTQIRTNERKAKVKAFVLEKKSIEEIASAIELTPNTVVNYIGRLLGDDETLDVGYLKESVVGYSDIVKAFEKLGSEKIGPIYSELGGNVDYSDISLVKVLMLGK
ncbi:MAG: helix-turn-helix domain-containing protein [Nanoarchaeota archaeon]|nr:helix-turn-helix domain-containing protein [Nanoarchaeota archaeon]